MDLSIVIVNYNTRNYTADCLDSIRENPPTRPFEIIVVDNASTDDSADWLEDNYPEIRLVRSPTNCGIAGGNNLGIRASKGRFVLLLNNDTLVLPGTLNQVVGFIESHPKAGGVGGQLLNPDGSFQSGFMDFPSLWQEFLIVTKIGSLLRTQFPSHPPVSAVREVDWMSTAFMLFQKEALESVGLVDEEFFIYSDESDLQYRLKKQGWKIYHLPDVTTIHYGGKSMNPWRRRKMVYRGYLLFYEKHYGFVRTLVLRCLFVIISGLKIPVWALARILPSVRERAKLEIKSNSDIFTMCLTPGVVPPQW